MMRCIAGMMRCIAGMIKISFSDGRGFGGILLLGFGKVGCG